MDILFVLENYKAALGAFSIAVATVIAVFINLNHTQRTEHRLKRERIATFSSAIAAELLDNAHNLMELHAEISRRGARYNRVKKYLQFNFEVYKNVLTEIGRLGPALSFMVVDIYGDLQKVSDYLQHSEADEIKNDKKETLGDIQEILAKTLTGSIVVAFYADYMLGPKWMRATTKQRLLWLENTIDDFCQYVDTNHKEARYDCSFDVEFKDRFLDTQQQAEMISLFETANKILDVIPRKRSWKVQLILRAFSYKIQSTMMNFLDVEDDYYIQKSAREYAELLPS